MWAFSLKSQRKTETKDRKGRCRQSLDRRVQGVGHLLGGRWLQVMDEDVKKLLASSVKSKKKNKPRKKRGAHAANGAEGDEIVKEKEQEEAREGIRAL